MTTPSHTSRRFRRRVAGGMLVGALLLVGCGGTDEDVGDTPYHGYERIPTPQVGDHALTDTSGETLRFTADEDGLLLVYFGYTSCPDICPTTLADLRAALDTLDGSDVEHIEVAMVSIDPEVDTPERLEDYVKSFIADARAVSEADEAELRPVANAFGADYGKDAELEAQGEDGVYHTTSLYAVDDAGDLVLTWSFGTTSEQMAEDLDRLLDRAA